MAKKAGYESLADTYIPFSNERENKIFTLAGIKHHAEGATRGGVNTYTRETKEGIDPSRVSIPKKQVAPDRPDFDD